jgi:hypothetical protein
MKLVNLNLWIDVSGIPYDDTCVGLIISTPQLISNTQKILIKTCPREFHKKASQLNHEENFRVLSIMNSAKLVMFTTKFSNKLWSIYKNEFGNNTDFKEKMMAYIYYFLMTYDKNQLYKNFSYLVITCVESYLDINKVHKYCKKLGESDKRQLSFSIARAEVADGIKLVDYVAHAFQKNRLEKLKKLENLYCVQIIRDNRLLRKLFD